MMDPRTLPLEGSARSWRTRARASLVGFVALAAVALGFFSNFRSAEQAQAHAAAPPPAKRAADARALFESYCLDCHSGKAPRGGFALDRLLAPGKAVDRRQWEKVWKLVRHEFMPPARADRPPDASRRAITRWIERAVFKVDEARPDPGRVTIRRLTRMEYHHTVRDLFGVELDLAQQLPPDDTAFGFDNIGDAQTVSPALLETYLTLAEKVVANVIVEDGPRHPQVRIRPNQFRPKGVDAKLNRAEQVATVEVKHAGRYKVELQFGVGGWQEYGGEYELTVTLGGRAVVGKKTISVGGNKTYTLSGEVALARGRHELVVATVPVKAGAFGKLARLPLSPRVVVNGPVGTGIYEYPESHTRVFFKGPAPPGARAKRAYARAILARVAAKAFRRPAGDAILDRLTDMALSGKTFEAGVAQAVTAILASPRFYYRAELQPNPDDPATVHPLDEYALASRLSYLLWLSLPDDELTGLAAKGQLRKALPRQLKRMLADPKSERFFEDFAGQWLRTRNILLAPVSGRAQQTVDPLRALMKRETDLLFEYIARQDRDLSELLRADYTFLNDRLASFYGVPGVQGHQMRRVQLPPGSRRAGVLTHASLLISTSNPNRTSPVKRGLFVLENLLGREVPPPPPAVASLEDARVGGKAPRTLREQLAAHRQQKSCAACHAHFDPLGLALENFDNTGRWRDRERGEPIDPKTKLLGGAEVSGAVDLARVLAARKEVFYRCVTEKLLTYALGRGLEPADAVTVDRITAPLAAAGGKFSVLLAAVVDSPPFQTRRGDAGEARDLRAPVRPVPPPPEKRKGPVRRKKFDRDQP
jgi:mono/diheme cytochrome c family protein